MSQEFAYSPIGPLCINETASNQENAGGVIINETSKVTAVLAIIVPIIFICT